MRRRFTIMQAFRASAFHENTNTDHDILRFALLDGLVGSAEQTRVGAARTGRSRGIRSRYICSEADRESSGGCCSFAAEFFGESSGADVVRRERRFAARGGRFH